MSSSSTIAIKDECPYPELYWAKAPYSILIETSQFGQATFDISNLLTLLRDQYPQGTSVNQRTITKYNNRSKPIIGKAGLFIEVGFPDEDARTKALKKPFIFNDQTIQVTKPLERPDFYHSTHRIQIYGIEKLTDPPNKYYFNIWNHLSKHGKVLELHLHYTELGNWLTGEGCAIWIDNKNFAPCDYEIKLGHPKLNFVVNDYIVNN